MVHSTASEAAPIPSHVPPHLVFDFDVYNAAAPDQDFHLAIKRLHGPDVPEVFWTPRQGGHWVLTRGDDIYKAFARCRSRPPRRSPSTRSSSIRRSTRSTARC